MENVNPHNKSSKDYWIWEAEQRGIVLLPEDDKMAEIKAKVEKFDLDNADSKETGVLLAEDDKMAEDDKIKILVPAGTRVNSKRLSEETEIEIEAKDWDKYSHIAVKVSL